MALPVYSSLESPKLSVDTAPKESMQDIFIKIDGIDGEALDANHKNWISVISFSYAVSQSSSAATGGGSGVGKANFSDLVFTHFVDKASPNLMMRCADGKHINKVELSCNKVGGGQQEYMKVTMEQVLITHVRPVGATNSARVIEEVGLSYGKIKVEVKVQNQDGSMGAATTGTWDVTQNKA